jgi:uncharacterized short protein YbdD (DUF466 family)
MTERMVGFVSRFARTLRFMIGAPDYERYVEHMSERHPNEKPLTRSEFASQGLEDRYARPGSRCC